MSHEEKLEEAKRLYETANADQKYVLESLFPELAESKDERVRKDLIIYLRSILSNKKYGDKFIESWIAWLEKQAEQKHTPKHKIGDTIYYNSFGEVKSMVVSDVAIDGTDNPMYEDKDGNAVFEKDLIEQKPARCAWTERDEKQARQIERIVHNDGCSKKLQEQIANWFKSLKDRVQPQPKQEWSEEDKRRIDHIIAFISDKERIKDTERMFPIEEDIRWLKFLKDRYTWRPSDEQMETLKYACGGNYVDLGVLDSLYNDLKKLKGE